MKQVANQYEVTLNLRGRSRQFGVKTINYVKVHGMQNMIIIGATLILFLIFTLISSFAGSSNLLTMTKSFVPYAILGLGVTFVIATGGIDLSIGTSCIASAVMAGAICETSTTVNDLLWLTIPLMLIFGLVFRADQRLSGGEVQTSAVYRNAGDHAVFPRDFRDNRGEHHRSLFCDQVPGVQLVPADLYESERLSHRPRLGRCSDNHLHGRNVQDEGRPVYPGDRKQ